MEPVANPQGPNLRPRVTIGLPVYNAVAEHLHGAIESVLSQAFEDLELLISDNASTDGTSEICRRYAASDPRVRYERLVRNVGAARNFNRLVYHARGAYFSWLCHDDYLSPSFVRECVGALDRNPFATTAAPATVVVGPDGDYRFTLTGQGLPLADPDPAVRYRAMIRALISDPSHLLMGHFEFGLHRRATLLSTRLEGSYVTADAVFATELALAGRILEVPEPLVFVRKPGRTARALESGDLLAARRILEPRATSRLVASLAQRRHYLEYPRSVLQSRIPLSAKLRALPSSFEPVVARYRAKRHQPETCACPAVLNGSGSSRAADR